MFFNKNDLYLISNSEWLPPKIKRFYAFELHVYYKKNISLMEIEKIGYDK